MPRDSVAVSDLLNWFGRVDRADCEALLIGCELDAGGSDEPSPIDRIEWGNDVAPVAFHLADGRRLPLRRIMKDGSLIDPREAAPLPAAIEQARTGPERAAIEMRRDLARIGVNAAVLRSANDGHAVVTLLHALEARQVPSGPMLRDAYSALSYGDSALARAGARLMREVIDLYRARKALVPEDCHWRLAKLLRNAGALREALDASASLETSAIKDAGARKILATTRCAALLDLWDATGESDLLDQAQRAFGVAWAVGQRDDELEHLRLRLNRILRRSG